MSEGPPTSGSGAEPGAQQAQPAQPEVPAGWYPHPTAPGWEAYWTGAAWGTETRPAQAAPPAPEPAAAQEAAAQEAQTAALPAAGTAAAAAGAGAAAQAQPAQSATFRDPAGPAPAEGGAGAVPTAATTVPPGAATATPAAAAPAAERSGSSLPAVLCVLGAIVAIVGCFLPMATSSVDAVDFADNTLVGQGYGIAVIAVAVIGAALAVWSYLKGNRTWLVVLLGAVIVAIAAYMGLVGVDDLTPDVSVPASFGKLDPSVASQLAQAAGQSANPDASASTGIFAAAIGGLLMVLGGVGIARENR